MAKLSAPSGFRDFLPDECRKRAELIRRIRETYESFGFEPIETPIVENLAVFLGKGGGENEKLMFRVLKRGADLPRAKGAQLARPRDLHRRRSAQVLPLFRDLRRRQSQFA